MISLVVYSNLYAEGDIYSSVEFQNDTLEDSNNKKEERKEARDQLRTSQRRFAIRAGYVYAFLDTEVSFQLAKGNLSSTLSLEDNLGLPANSFFFFGSFLYRITPRSGIYAQYYGINRTENSTTEKDYIFKDDSIPAGSNINVHFNTQVVSAGYLLSVLKDQKTYLGFYFNIYLMVIETGVNSELEAINSYVELLAPLPNFGLLASFRLNKWLILNGGLGFFALHTSSFEGSIFNLDISLMAKPLKWLGISLSYQEFDVRVIFPTDDINTTVDYNFRGPALGLSFVF